MFEICELCVEFCYNEQSFQILLSMAPTSKLHVSRVDARSIRKGSMSDGTPLPNPKPVFVNLGRVDSKRETRSPPLPEDGPTSENGAGSSSGDGSVFGDGPEPQGTGSLDQSANVE